MTTQVKVQLTNGKTLNALNYRIDPGSTPTDTAALATQISGGLSTGTYHVRGPNGWIDIPANQVQNITYMPLRSS